jgi:hypothetical protein
MQTFTRRRAAAVAAAALALLPATAYAATIQGGPGNERLRGTRAADVIDGNAGNDRIFGLAGDDRLVGGLGNDRIFGGAGNDTILGAGGNDWLNGGPGNDAISGDANDTGDRTSFDRIFGAGGDDTLRGGDPAFRIPGGWPTRNSRAVWIEPRGPFGVEVREEGDDPPRLGPQSHRLERDHSRRSIARPDEVPAVSLPRDHRAAPRIRKGNQDAHRVAVEASRPARRARPERPDALPDSSRRERTGGHRPEMTRRHLRPNRLGRLLGRA